MYNGFSPLIFFFNNRTICLILMLICFMQLSQIVSTDCFNKSYSNFFFIHKFRVLNKENSPNLKYCQPVPMNGSEGFGPGILWKSLIVWYLSSGIPEETVDSKLVSLFNVIALDSLEMHWILIFLANLFITELNWNDSK